MIPEQAVRHAARGESRKGIGKQFEIRRVVMIVGEDAPLVIPACEDMVEETRRMQTQRAAHGRRLGNTFAGSELHINPGIQPRGVAPI